MSIAPTSPVGQSVEVESAGSHEPDAVFLDMALYGPADRFLLQTGKQFRAAMVREAYLATGGRGEVPIQITEAIELLHAGSLIIDDIEDGSDTRRGRATLHREVGLPLALNTGNWMYFQSLERLAQTPLPPALIQGILTRSIITVRRCHEGQALDLGASVESIAANQIYAIARKACRLKTGGLTALAAWLGATVAGADAVRSRALARFGMVAGVCLQMKNDLHELRSFVDGDTRCDDLRNARVTWIWAWASKLVAGREMSMIQRRLRLSGGDINECRAIARNLLEIIGSRGDDYVKFKLQKSLRLLGEHIESTSGLRSTLERLQNKR